MLALTRGSDSFGIGGGGEHMLIMDLQQMRVEIVGKIGHFGKCGMANAALTDGLLAWCVLVG